jgi:CRP-like cAMP-binding protein
MTNQLLARLSEQDRALLTPNLERISFAPREKIARAGQAIKHAYFPDSGIIAVVVSKPTGNGHQIEVAMIGREGMAGTSIVLCDGHSPHDLRAYIGGEGRRIRADHLHAACETSATLRALLLCYAHSLLIQIAETAFTNGHAKIEQRAARWLLMAHDRTMEDKLLVTHEFLARALLVHRPGVTLALHHLQALGLVKAVPRSLTIIDREGLEAFARPAYGVAETEYRRLFPS